MKILMLFSLFYFHTFRLYWISSSEFHLISVFPHKKWIRRKTKMEGGRLLGIMRLLLLNSQVMRCIGPGFRVSIGWGVTKCIMAVWDQCEIVQFKLTPILVSHRFRLYQFSLQENFIIILVPHRLLRHIFGPPVREVVDLLKEMLSRIR